MELRECPFSAAGAMIKLVMSIKLTAMLCVPITPGVWITAREARDHHLERRLRSSGLRCFLTFRLHTHTPSLHSVSRMSNALLHLVKSLANVLLTFRCLLLTRQLQMATPALSHLNTACVSVFVLASGNCLARCLCMLFFFVCPASAGMHPCSSSC